MALIIKRFKEHNKIPGVILGISLAATLLIPFKIISYGYLPFDDALGRAAKVISGKDWSQILVLKNGIAMDFYPGWNQILTAFHQLTGCGIDGLVVFSVVSLFMLFLLIPVIFLKRPEGWLLALIVSIIAEPIFLIRLFSGRPLVFTMAALIFILFNWDKFKSKNVVSICLITTFVFAFAIWVHPASSYLFLLPIACFLLAREWKTALTIGLCYLGGVLLGALFTKQPLLFLSYALNHGIGVFKGNPASSVLVGELTPGAGNILILIFVGLMLGWRKLQNKWEIKRIDNPVFILGVLGWALGLAVFRLWVDWGLPALIVWMTGEFNLAFEKMKYSSWKRAITACIATIALFLMITANTNNRWTFNSNTKFLSQENPVEATWLPEPNGILYSADMSVFFRVFYKNPNAKWRYILGPEPTMMPEEDLAIYRSIMLDLNNPRAYDPWIRKMTPLDRLFILSMANAPPPIPRLEWYHIAPQIWVGRIPKR